MAIADAIDGFGSDLATPHHRFNSWDHCYLHFRKAREEPRNEERVKVAALNLAYYLASWGMLRGSSQWLWKDYTIYVPIVETALKPEFERLWNVDDEVLACPDHAEWVADSIFGKRGFRAQAENAVAACDPDLPISDILISKIMLGTFGCCVAHDNFVKRGLYQMRMTQKMGRRAFAQLAQFYRDNRTELEAARASVPNYYPPMKSLDMYFWQVGRQATGGSATRSLEESLDE